MNKGIRETTLQLAKNGVPSLNLVLFLSFGPEGRVWTDIISYLVFVLSFYLSELGGNILDGHRFSPAFTFSCIPASSNGHIAWRWFGDFRFTGMWSSIYSQVNKSPAWYFWYSGWGIWMGSQGNPCRRNHCSLYKLLNWCLCFSVLVMNSDTLLFTINSLIQACFISAGDGYKSTEIFLVTCLGIFCWNFKVCGSVPCKRRISTLWGRSSLWKFCSFI